MKRATTHGDLQQLYKENLEPDFLPFKDIQYKVSDLHQMVLNIAKGRPPKHLSLLLVKDNVARAIPLLKAQPQLSAKRVRLGGEDHQTLKCCSLICDPPSIRWRSCWMGSKMQHSEACSYRYRYQHAL